MAEKQTRIQWIDIAKGIAIILMILGHTGCPEILKAWIFSFHMPLFFILSGITTNWGQGKYKEFVLKKFRSIMIPFLCYSVIICLILFIFEIDHPFSSLKHGWGAYALWFVPVFYVALILAGFFLIVLRLKPYHFLILLLLPLSSYALSSFDIRLPWNMSVAPYAAFFVVLGAFFKRYLDAMSSSSKRLRILWMTVSLVITLVISRFWSLDMNCNIVRPMLPLTIAAIAGSCFISIISIFIQDYTHFVSSFFQAVGQETFLILAFSQVIIQIINKYFVMNSIIKYIILIVVLIVLSFAKKLLLAFFKSVGQIKN